MRQKTRFKINLIAAGMIVIVTAAAVTISALPHVLLVPGGMIVIDPSTLTMSCLAIVAAFGYLLTPELFIPVRRVRKQ